MSSSLIPWQDTHALRDHVTELLGAFPDTFTFLKSFADRVDELTQTYDWREPSEPFLRPFAKAAKALYEAESLCTPPPPFSDSLIATIEGARYRDHLLALYRKAQSPRTTLEVLKNTLACCYLLFVSHLPKVAWTDPSDNASLLPLVDSMNVPHALNDLLELFLDENLATLGLFSHLRQQLSQNQLDASEGNRKKLITPLQFKGSPSELVHAFLKHTLLEDLFAVKLPFAIPDETRFSGHWIIAPPGRGKTTLLHHLFLEDLKKDASIIVMDSKGDLVPPLSRLADIQDRLVIIEPDPDYPLALNPLDIPASNIAHTISLLEYVFSSLLEAKMTALQMTLFRNVLPAIVQCVPNPTMHTFRDIIESGVGRYANYFGNLPPLSRSFFEQQFNSKTYTDTRNQLVWRLDFLMTNPLIRAMFEAPKTKLDIGKEIDAGKVILINNSKELLGDEGAEFFGRFFIALVLSAAQKRSSRRAQDKLPCYFYIDECQSVIHRDPKIATILDECRSQKIGLILAHQRTQQITDQNVLDALFNCAIRMANSDDEAKYLSDKLRTTPEFLRSLPVGTFATYVRDLTPTALALGVPYRDLAAMPQLSTSEQATLKAHMREQYSFHPQQVSFGPPDSTPPAEPAKASPRSIAAAEQASPEHQAPEAGTTW